MSDNNIIPLHIVADDPKAALKNVIAHLPEILEYSKVRAEICRADYLAYLEQGFTEEQALTLSKPKF